MPLFVETWRAMFKRGYEINKKKEIIWKFMEI